MFRKLKERLFQNLHARQTIAKNVFWLSMGQIGSRLLRGLIIIYAARVLGLSQYGIFSYVLGLAGFFTIFVDSGINSILTREAAKNPEEASYSFATSFWIKIGVLILTAALLIFVAPYFSKIEAAKALLHIVALLTIFDGLREFTTAYFRSEQKMELEALVTTMTNVAITVFGFIILYFAATAEALVITYTLSAGAGTLMGIVILRKQFVKIFSHFRKELVPKILKSAWPVALTGIMGVFMLQIDILMLGFFKSAADIGLYSAGQKIIQLLYVVPNILAIAVFPIFSKFIGRDDNDKAKLLMEEGVSTVMMVALPLTIGGIVLAKSIIGFLYGAAYLPATTSFQILIFSLIPVFPNALFSNYILAYDKQVKATPYVAVGSLANVIFNIILIPPYGIVGAAIATAGAQIIFNGLFWRLAKKVNNFFVLGRLKKMTLAAIIMGIMSFTLDKLGLNVLLNIVISAGLYFGILYTFKEKILVELKSLITT